MERKEPGQEEQNGAKYTSKSAREREMMEEKIHTEKWEREKLLKETENKLKREEKRRE